jgi:hypothetical protein
MVVIYAAWERHLSTERRGTGIAEMTAEDLAKYSPRP